MTEKEILDAAKRLPAVIIAQHSYMYCATLLLLSYLTSCSRVTCTPWPWSLYLTATSFLSDDAVRSITSSTVAAAMGPTRDW